MGQLDGRCLCGQVSYACDGDPVTTAICHCTDCQRSTGTAFSVVVAVERETFTLNGESKSFVTIGEDTHEAVQRVFCPNCGSPLCSYPDATPDLVFIKAGTLDERGWLEPEMELWARSAHPYVTHDEENRGVFERSVPT